MSESLLALAVGLSALAVGCGGGPNADPRGTGTAGNVTSQAAPLTSPRADGGSSEIPALTEDELRRRLDALEQEIDDH